MASDVIYIGCKIPTGIVLDLDHYERISENTGALRTVKGKLPPVTLKGDAYKFGVTNPLNIDGYVFTPVPVEFWDEWVKLHADSSLLADGLLKPAATLDAGRKIAREHEKERGLNPRLVEKDPRIRATGVKAFEPKDDGIAA